MPPPEDGTIPGILEVNCTPLTVTVLVVVAILVPMPLAKVIAGPVCALIEEMPLALPGAVQVPSARRKLVLPPPDAGTIPEIVEVKGLALIVIVLALETTPMPVPLLMLIDGPV
jgi:hypothetical protein